MDSLSSFAFVTLLLFWEYFGQGQANGTCSTEEMRKIAVEDAMKALGCNSYDCGKLPYFFFFICFEST